MVSATGMGSSFVLVLLPSSLGIDGRMPSRLGGDGGEWGQVLTSKIKNQKSLLRNLKSKGSGFVLRTRAPAFVPRNRRQDAVAPWGWWRWGGVSVGVEDQESEIVAQKSEILELGGRPSYSCSSLCPSKSTAGWRRALGAMVASRFAAYFRKRNSGVDQRVWMRRAQWSRWSAVVALPLSPESM